MTDFSATGKYYTIGHLVQMTGLTDRTIRSYLSSGIIEGEKINGVWHFTPEQTEEFISHPAVRPSLQAKRNALVYDFMLEDKRKEHECCIILDIPEGSKQEIAEYFCYAINNGDFCNLRFSFDGIAKTPRIILKGSTNEVLELVNRYYNR